MATSTNLATMARSRLVSGYTAAKRALSNMREQAEIGAQRLLIGGAALGSGYGVGYANGWARRTNTKLTIGNSTMKWTQVGGAIATLGGAFLSKPLGETVANGIFGLGVGALAGEAALAGDVAGATPPPPGA